MEILKKVETYKAYSEEEAESFIAKIKLDPDKEGYELKGYKIVKKEKKSKGEIIDEWWEIITTKSW